MKLNKYTSTDDLLFFADESNKVQLFYTQYVHTCRSLTNKTILSLKQEIMSGLIFNFEFEKIQKTSLVSNPLGRSKKCSGLGVISEIDFYKYCTVKAQCSISNLGCGPTSRVII